MKKPIKPDLPWKNIEYYELSSDVSLNEFNEQIELYLKDRPWLRSADVSIGLDWNYEDAHISLSHLESDESYSVRMKEYDKAVLKYERDLKDWEKYRMLSKDENFKKLEK